MKKLIKITATVKNYEEAKELLSELEVLKENFLVTVEIVIANSHQKPLAIDLPDLENQ